MGLRNITFRGKRMDNGEWTYGSLLTYADGSCFICCEIYPGKLNKLQVNPATVGQYTGLTDKKGKKIFEGDILKWDNEWPDYCEVAKWDYELLDMRKNDWSQFCEVIGNQWDNPELLEVKK